MDDKELLKLTPGELVDLGICPTCFNRKHNGALYGDNSDKLIYEDKSLYVLIRTSINSSNPLNCLSTNKKRRLTLCNT